MALTNSQYDALLRTYEQTQYKNRRILELRTNAVYAAIPHYQEIDSSISSLCVAKGKQMLLGDEHALSEMKVELHKLSGLKRQLLEEHGFAPDYLNPIYDCKDCKDTGYIENKKCHCLEKKIVDLLYKQSNLSDMLYKENFNTLSYEYYTSDSLSRFEAAVTASKKFVQDFKLDYQNLFFYGTVGTGKSFLSNCIAKELLNNGHSVIYFSSSALFDQFAKTTFDYKAKEELERMSEDLFSCDLLIIDDLGTELTNAFVASSLFTFLNERHLRRKSTVISTNLSLEELRDRYSDRIFSRISSNFKLYKLTGTDIRMYKKRIANRK